MNKKFILLPVCLLLLASCTGGTTPSDPVDPPEPPGPVDPVHDGLTPETAFTGAEILELAAEVIPDAGQTSTDKVYIKDTVTSVKEVSPKTSADDKDHYGNATFFFGEFQIYRAKKYDNGSVKDIMTSDTEIADIQAGDTVCVYGQITNYNGTIETVANQAGIVSVEFGSEHKTATDEPALVTGKSLAEIVADNAEDFAFKYEITATISKWYTKNDVTNEDSTVYGNFHVKDNAETEVLIYGATLNESRLAWNGFKYTYSSVGDLDTSLLHIGDEVKMEVVRTEYKGTKQLQGIIRLINGEEPAAGEAKEEPEMIESMNLSEIVADIDHEDMEVMYGVTMTVKDWSTSKGTKNTDATKYGSFIATDGSEAEVLVYGATFEGSALVWDGASGKYVFTNPNNFDPTKLSLNDEIAMKVCRTRYKDTIELVGVIVDVAS